MFVSVLEELREESREEEGNIYMLASMIAPKTAPDVSQESK